MSTAVELVQPVGSSFHEHALSLPARVREVMAHGVRHGDIVALAVAHLYLQPRVDLRGMALGFPLRAEVSRNIDVGQLIAKFSAAANVVAMVVSVEKVIKDTLR